MTDLSRIRLLGELLTVDPQYRLPPPGPMVLHMPSERRDARPSGVRINMSVVRQEVPSSIPTTVPDPDVRSDHRVDYSFGVNFPHIYQRNEFSPYETYYHGMEGRIGYFHTAWKRGSLWEGSVGLMGRYQVAFGNFRNNGSFIMGGALCAAVRQSVTSLVSFDAYVCPELAHSELNFGRASSSIQPTPSFDFGIAMALEATVHLPRNWRYAPGIFAGIWQTFNLSGTAAVAGAEPTRYQNLSFVVGTRFFFDPILPVIPRDHEDITIEEAQRRERVASENLASLDRTVQNELSGQPTRSDYAASIRELNDQERALCENIHLQTSWLNHRPPSARFSFVFTPRTPAQVARNPRELIPTQSVRVYLNQPAPQLRNAELDRIAGEIRRIQDMYFIVDGYSIDRATPEANTDLSRQRVEAVRAYFERVHPQVASRLIIDDQSAHGQDASIDVSASLNPAEDARYYLINAVTFTMTTAQTRADCACIQEQAPVSAHPDPDNVVRLHTEYRCE